MDDDKTESEDLPSTETVRPDSPDLPERVGPYRILQKIGEGGMGEVYHAEQENYGEAIRRLVLAALLFVGFMSSVYAEDFDATMAAGTEAFERGR